MTRRRRWRVGVIGVATLAAGLGVWQVLGRASGAADVESVEVTSGRFQDRVTIRGEIRALRSQALTAPADAGELRILAIAPNGSAVKRGDVVIAFDASSLRQRLDERQSDLRASGAEIARAEAEGRIKLEEFTTGRVTAEFDVERARLDVRAGSLQSRFDQAKAELSLSDKQQKLDETDTVLDSGRAVTRATVGGLRGKQERAQAEVARTSRGLDALVIRAPTDGLMVILENWRAGQFGQGSRPFQVGDSAWPGAQIAELPDLSSARMTAMVDEVDRSRLTVGQDATVRIDAVADRDLPARLISISTIAKTDISGGWPPKRGFEVVLELLEVEPKVRPGMTAVARVTVGAYENMTLVPSRALFPFGGRTVAYVVTGRGLEPRLVRVAHRTDEVSAINAGLSVGDRVAVSPPEDAAARLAALEESTR